MIFDDKFLSKTQTSPLTYEIKLKGHLRVQWSDWFENMTITYTAEDNTMLTGEIADQAALHGVLKKINNLGLVLLSVTIAESENE